MTTNFKNMTKLSKLSEGARPQISVPQESRVFSTFGFTTLLAFPQPWHLAVRELTSNKEGQLQFFQRVSEETCQIAKNVWENRPKSCNRKHIK